MSSKGATTCIRVISLAGADERRRTFAERAAATSLEWSFFDACEEKHASLCYDADQVLERLGRGLTKGEIGCFSSHYALWEEFENAPEAQLLVLEDDVLVDWAFVSQLCQMDISAHGVEYLRLFYKNPTKSILKQRGFVDRQHNLIELFGFAWGTQAYIMTKEGAQSFRSACAEIEMPIDDQMDRSWRHGIPNLAIFPPVVLEESVASSIGSERFKDSHQREAMAAFRAREFSLSKRSYLSARLKHAIKRRLPGGG